MNFFLDAADRFTDTVSATTDWSAASPCADWTAAEVVDHVVDAERDFLGRHDVDLGERPSGEPAEVWAAHLAAVRPVVEDDAFLAREFDGFFGRTTIGTTLDNFYGFDLVVHGWDLGASNGRPTTFTDDEMDTMDTAFEGFGEHAYDEGVFRQPVDVPEDADRQTKLLARMGRSSVVE
ncbi:TIGR03086 family metal-binding protein [Nocardioides hankookensis]|uniref:Mycothiol-dependent maleylpyruvate isomerase metal-binding domain-containing protein n=1 Tax=Nocardioides hankookensis TaxID=443157 RepID=A0ABW1LSK9_9ACTN